MKTKIVRLACLPGHSLTKERNVTVRLDQILGFSDPVRDSTDNDAVRVFTTFGLFDLKPNSPNNSNAIEQWVIANGGFA